MVAAADWKAWTNVASKLTVTFTFANVQIIFAVTSLPFGDRVRQDHPIETTLELVDVIRGAMPDKALREKQHPAKRSFQAIRIAVNDELGAVSRVMRDAVACLRPGGRLAVITFHSLEDRIVKNAMAEAAKGCTCPPNFPVCVCGNKPKIEILTKKPIIATREEVEENPRSRSAKLRVAEKL